MLRASRWQGSIKHSRLSYRRQPVKRTTAWITLVKSPLSRPLLCLISSARVRIKPSGHTCTLIDCSWSGVSSSLGPTRQGHRLDPRMAVAYSTYLEKKWSVRIAGTTSTICKDFQLASLRKNSDQPLATGMDTHTHTHTLKDHPHSERMTNA